MLNRSKKRFANYMENNQLRCILDNSYIGFDLNNNQSQRKYHIMLQKDQNSFNCIITHAVEVKNISFQSVHIK